MVTNDLPVESASRNTAAAPTRSSPTGIKSSSAARIPLPENSAEVLPPALLPTTSGSEREITVASRHSDVESTYGEDTRTAMVLRTNPTHVPPEVAHMEALLIGMHDEAGRPQSDDVSGRYRQNAAVFASHGIRTAAQLRGAERAALLHDGLLKILEGMFKMAGYTGGLLVAANYISPKVMPAPLIPFLNGALTCLSANFSGRVTSHALENAYASGQARRLPPSTATWAGAEQALKAATRAGVNDLTRQTVPVAAALHQLALGTASTISASNSRLVILDAVSRPISSILDTLGVSVLDLPAGLLSLLGRSSTGSRESAGSREVTFRESFRLQHPEDLDNWLNSAGGKSGLSLFKPSAQGSTDKLAGALDGLLHVVGDLPHVAAMMTMVGVYILMSVYAGNGAVASFSKEGLAEGMESARSAATRQVIFSGGEVALEFGLVALPVILSALTGGKSENLRDYGAKLVDHISPSTHKPKSD